MLSAASPSAPAMFARAPLSALATNAAMQPLLVALCGGAAGFDRTHPPSGSAAFSAGGQHNTTKYGLICCCCWGAQAADVFKLLSSLEKL